MGYQTVIRETMASIGRIGAAEPAHIEAWMRLEHGTLDGLSKAQFAAEVSAALDCIADAPMSDTVALVMWFGL